MHARSPEQAAISSASQLPVSLLAAPARIAYLESIRGLAAIQVLLLHFFFAFVPDLLATTPSSALAAAIHRSPLYFLYDGYSAVYIFFCLSGYVLTRSFERQLDQPPVQILARAIRLGLPALAATVVAASLMLIIGRANVEAGRLMGNAWFSQQWNADLSVLSIVRDGTINALFLGYSNMPGVAFLAPWQQTIEQSFVTPLWTLSIEFYGSVAILFLCLCARRSRHLRWTAVVLGTLFTIRSAYICFFVGHLLAVVHRAERPVSKHQLLPMALVVSGVACCVVTDLWQPGWLITLCSYKTYWLFPGQLPPMQQKAFGAALVLAGIIDLRVCRNFLSKPWLVAYSRLSFPIYLIHWPIMCGLAATVFVYLSKIVSIHLAQMCALTLGIAASAAASVVFAAVDRYALGLSSRLRRRTVNPATIMQHAGIAKASRMGAAASPRQ
ncbi:acyltransferase family protein [Bradyrhizobium sp.]|jgi:peptidoglycan/LPS O-acetylase OafA/YrhL|uniref:acyltransferase family protein n=1 Tax=Bradyrhizobium sp. TaxID=376 RepID=UPI003C4F693F